MYKIDIEEADGKTIITVHHNISKEATIWLLFSLIWWIPLIIGIVADWNFLGGFITAGGLPGLVLTYAGIAGFVNKTVITADKYHVTLKDVPFTYFRNQNINTRAIDKIVAKRNSVTTSWTRSNPYLIEITTKSNRKIMFMRSGESDKLKEIAQEIKSATKMFKKSNNRKH